MKKLIYLLLVAMLVSGCTSSFMVYQKQDWQIDYFQDSKCFKKITVKASYPETFKVVISVFRDLSINILKKDYEKGSIFGSRSPYLRYNYYGAFFKEINKNEIEIILKANHIAISSGLYLENEFILSQIQKELEFQRVINADE
ncbi:MAG: hypothetical protein P9M02_02220 [Candidatus Susulua stagnicola]|nr:hypothetical protein [Candidatus Susulua stagnicola]